MKNIYFFICLFLGLKMCFGDDIEEIVKTYHGQPLNEVKFDFSKENCNKISRLIRKFYLREKASLLWAYVCLNTKEEDCSLVENFYSIAEDKRHFCRDYSDQWKFVYNQAWEHLKEYYNINDDELNGVIGSDLKDLEIYGSFPFDDPYVCHDTSLMSDIKQQLEALNPAKLDDRNNLEMREYPFWGIEYLPDEGGISSTKFVLDSVYLRLTLSRFSYDFLSSARSLIEEFFKRSIKSIILVLFAKITFVFHMRTIKVKFFCKSIGRDYHTTISK